MIEVVWSPSTEGAARPILPGYEGGKQRYFHGTAKSEGVVFSLPDDPRNETMIAALPPSFVRANLDPREAVMAELRRLGIPHKKNEKLETLQKKVPV